MWRTSERRHGNLHLSIFRRWLYLFPHTRYSPTIKLTLGHCLDYLLLLWDVKLCVIAPVPPSKLCASPVRWTATHLPRLKWPKPKLATVRSNMFIEVCGLNGAIERSRFIEPSIPMNDWQGRDFRGPSFVDTWTRLVVPGLNWILEIYNEPWSTYRFTYGIGPC